jgi:hypothetical protein
METTMPTKYDIFWKLESGGIRVSDPVAAVTIKGPDKWPRRYGRPSNASIQRLINLSNGKRIGVELEDGKVTVYGLITIPGDNDARNNEANQQPE